MHAVVLLSTLDWSTEMQVVVSVAVVCRKLTVTRFHLAHIVSVNQFTSLIWWFGVLFLDVQVSWTGSRRRCSVSAAWSYSTPSRGESSPSCTSLDTFTRVNTNYVFFFSYASYCDKYSFFFFFIAACIFLLDFQTTAKKVITVNEN